ncbi:LOW QUALITY PROTEIN: dihydrolipoyl dehydrogenase, putative [Eimeria necatrix]|uniref:Dihydrolipoyl dehydrogenase n=1 Tax=Eimeria necatrix TaxID=51315 RepID=U6ML82_9EIME|nr:LOW QUALITY PROTEIN: dihydrolipoyl dehydrogenase, putative [Eimeria necatrix]CDJ65002.1 dihydrolipoyl dehydrogenase, putative [Eimeria necatrix]
MTHGGDVGANSSFEVSALAAKVQGCRDAVAPFGRKAFDGTYCTFVCSVSENPPEVILQGEYDLVVIGGGPGGYVAAIKAAQLGLKTACVEKRGALGGTCLNVGCIPSKALLNMSHKYKEASSDFSRFGIRVSDVSVDISSMQNYKDKIVLGLTQGIEGLFKRNKVAYLKGTGRLAGPHAVQVHPIDAGDPQILTAKNVILATGSEPAPLVGGALEVDEETIVSSTGALALPRVPKHLVVVGGGVIGLELGSVWRNLGAEVTVVEFCDKIIPALDAEIGRAFQKLLERQGIKFMFGTKVVGSQKTDGGVTLSLENVKSGDASEVQCDVVLVAVGRRPYTKNLGLEELGINLDNRGRVVVNEQMQVPNYPNIMAIGDLIQGPMLAHKAEEEGIACVERLAGKGDGTVRHDTIPSVIYTHPELAGVGKTEEQLKAEGVVYKRGAFPFAANSRARATGDSDGLVKVLTCKETDKILGVWILGPNAGELIAEAVLAMEYGASSEDLGRVCHAHPTQSEALKEACMACFDKPIHIA